MIASVQIHKLEETVPIARRILKTLGVYAGNQEHKTSKKSSGKTSTNSLKTQNGMKTSKSETALI